MNKIKFKDYLKEGISNKYELIILAGQRVHALNNGASSYFKNGDDNHKNTIIALEEVEKEFLDISELRENLVRGLQEEGKDYELQEDYNFDEDDEYQVDLIDFNIISQDQEDLDIHEDQEDLLL